MTTPTDTLRRAIAERGLTQAQAATALGISASYLSVILSKRRGISAYVAVKAEMAWGVDGRRLLIDQALMEYEVAKYEYGKERQP